MKSDVRDELNLPDLNQVGFVVRDLDAALALYAPMFGPFTTLEPGPMRYHYRGQEEACDMLLAFGRSGDVEIELIQWVSGGCPHKEFLDAGREGMHHLRFTVEDLEGAVSDAGHIGYTSIWGKRYGAGLAVAYLERRGDPLLIEFFENHRGG
ncbi:MAG: VOC family protein [Halioglobus sp.]|nr:VOC family protein [Halioglobus sp.]